MKTSTQTSSHDCVCYSSSYVEHGTKIQVLIVGKYIAPKTDWMHYDMAKCDFAGCTVTTYHNGDLHGSTSEFIARKIQFHCKNATTSW